MSSDRYAVISLTATVYLLSKSGPTTVFDDASIFEAPVDLLVEAAPPSTIKGVYILSDTDFQVCRQKVEAVQKAGYTDIELVETFRFGLSSMIYGLPLTFINGAIVFVLAEALGEIPIDQASVAILCKREKGWQFISADKHPLEALAEYPSVRDIVYPNDTPEGYESVMEKTFPGRRLHLSAMQHPFFMETFFRNLINNGDLDGYEVLPFCIFNLMVEFGDKFESIYLDDVPPLTITKTIDIGDALTVQIRACESDANNLPLVRNFKFTSTKFRTVEVTVTVDKTLVPHVTLKTITSHDNTDAVVALPQTIPQKVATQNPVFGTSKYSVVYTVMHSNPFLIASFHQNGETAFKRISTIDDAVDFIKEWPSNSAAALVLFYYSELSTVNRMQTFRDKCRETGFSNVLFIPYETASLSMLLGSLQYDVNDGKSVAIVYPEKYYVVVRDCRRLKIRTSGRFDVDNINSQNVDGVIISNISRPFTQDALDELLPKLKPKNVQIATESTKFFLFPFLRSIVDESASNDYAFNDFCDFDVVVNGQRSILTRFSEIPFSVTAEVVIVDKKVLEVQLLRFERLEPLKTFPIALGTKSVRVVVRVESACDITVTMEDVGRVKDADKPNTVSGSVESTVTLPKKPSQPEVASSVSTKQPIDNTMDTPLQLPTSNDAAKGKKNRSQRRKLARLNAAKNGTADEPAKPTDISASNDDEVDTNRPITLPTTVLTFTSDNRVLINADKTYTGDKELLAYVRLQCGKAPEVGKRAFDALKEDPSSVFYDVPRLFATDFDPDHPDPSWRFKTTRDADGKVVIRGGNGVITFPIVVFGLVVRSTLLYVQEHVKSEITSLGIRLPSGSVIPDTELKDVSKPIGVELVLL